MSAKKGSKKGESKEAPSPPKQIQPVGFRKFVTKEEQAKINAAKARKRKRMKKLKEEKQKALERAEEEKKRAQELADQRWRDCLQCMRDSVPALKKNPWLIIQEPLFVHNYLDSLTETINNLAKYKDQLDKVRSVLQDVYEAFVDLGKFAKHQPAFYISNPQTIKRFVRLLGQVAHKGSDKALFPNVLCLLGPSFEREELYELFADARITDSLMSFARNEWAPTPATLALLLQIFELIGRSPRLRSLVMEDPGYDRLMGLTFGTIEGFERDQQAAAQQALRDYPAPQKTAAAISELKDLKEMNEAKELKELREKASKERADKERKEAKSGGGGGAGPSASSPASAGSPSAASPAAGAGAGAGAAAGDGAGAGAAAVAVKA